MKASDKGIINAYKAKTGLSEDELLELMKNETYMSADEAVEKGFADEIMTFNESEAVASIGNGLLPQAVIDEFFEVHGKRRKEIEAMKREIEKEEILQGL